MMKIAASVKNIWGSIVIWVKNASADSAAKTAEVDRTIDNLEREQAIRRTVYQTLGIAAVREQEAFSRRPWHKPPDPKAKG